MQQTEKYKFNLIERDDAFSPDALNENTRKLEAALSLKSDAADTDVMKAALDQRIQTLENHKVVAGTYVGNADKNGMHVELGFTPVVLVVPKSSTITMVTTESPQVSPALIAILRIEEGGFFANDVWNSAAEHYFIAFG